MLLYVKKHLALAAAVMMTAALGTGCSGAGQKTADEPTAKAKVSVSSALTIATIGSLKLTIDSSATGTPTGTIGFPIVTLLNKAPAGNVWTGNVTNIPANATGVNRNFTVQAFASADGTGAPVYEGSKLATVVAGQTAQVTIVLQELGVQPGPSNYAPVITAITATNSYVLPGQAGSFSVSAQDPDAHFTTPRPQFNGEPLAYQWVASCTNGTLALGTPTSATTTFTAPTLTPPATDSLCTVSIKVSETTAPGRLLANPLSVTTYFTLSVNNNFGDADVFAFPNSYPIVTVEGDFRYNFFSDVLTIPVGQQGDLRFTATDPDGDNVRFDLSGQCNVSGFDSNGNQSPPVTPIAANQFSAITFTTITGGPVSPPTSFTSPIWNVTFGHPAPVAAFTDPKQSCQFTVVVHDLCTAGNCGSAITGGAGLPDGSNKITKIGGVDVTSSTTGYINASAPSQPRRAPAIVRAVAPNQNGGNSSTGNSWDPKKVAIVQPGLSYNLSAEAYDQYEAGPLTVAWSCNLGTAGAAPVNVQTNGIKSLQSSNTWLAPSPLQASMFCTATFTSTASTLSTVVTFKFASNDPCSTLTAGASCSTGNQCVTGETCSPALVCGNGTPQHRPAAGAAPVAGACTASDACHTAGTCDGNTGLCSNPIVTTPTACNADSSGCTVNDACNLATGACVPGPAPVCNTPTQSFCVNAAGTCTNTGTAANNFNSYTCAYAPTPGVACTVANATVKCSGTNTFTSFACDATGACVGSGSLACVNTTCASGSTCQTTGASAGLCGGGLNQPTTVTCNDGNACTGTAATPDHCDGLGTCVGGAAVCPASQSCTPGTGVCVASNVVNSAAWNLQLTAPAGVAHDASGNAYVGGTISGITNVNFQTRAGGLPAINLKSLGGFDMFLAKYDTTGNITWGITVQDNTAAALTDQSVTGVAVSANGHVAVTGKVAGAVTFGTATVGRASPTPFIGVFDGTPATAPLRLWAHDYDLGPNGKFNVVASNPNHTANRIAACGFADAAAGTAAGAPGAIDLVPGATFGGATDLVMGVWNPDGTLAWSKQVGGALNENCAAIAIADDGNVVATGQFDGLSLAFGGTCPSLTGPGNSGQKYMWVAKFDGATGACTSAVAYLGTLGNAVPRSLAIAPASGVITANSVVVAGSFTGNLTIGTGAPALMTTAGSEDGFVVLLDSVTLGPVWNPVRFGGTGLDLVTSVAVTSFGDIVALGTFNASSVAFHTANGGNDTNGGFGIISQGGADFFVAKFNGQTGATDGAAGYGNAGSQGGNVLSVNRFGTNQTAFTGSSPGTVLFPPSYTSVGATDVALVFGNVQ
jgi:hypothetical protein